MKKVLIALIAISCLGCGEDNILAPNQVGLGSSSEVTIVSSPTLQIDQLFSDDFNIISATPYEGHFEIIVEYSGGCEEHEFELYWDHLVAESFPMQTGMTLAHMENDDNCDGIATDTLTIDYQSIDGFSNQDMIVHMFNGSSDQVVTIDSRGTQLITEECTLEVDMKRAICGYGIWGDLYFKLPQGIGAWEHLWLQPLLGSEQMELMNPAEASGVKVQIKPIFGYQWPPSNGDAICLALPEGVIIPVEVLCME
ncbi:MAG: hypothetical protein RIF33_17235 [Cyclobacteriaceae bacterium]